MFTIKKVLFSSAVVVALVGVYALVTSGIITHSNNIPATAVFKPEVLSQDYLSKNLLQKTPEPTVIEQSADGRGVIKGALPPELVPVKASLDQLDATVIQAKQTLEQQAVDAEGYQQFQRADSTVDNMQALIAGIITREGIDAAALSRADQEQNRVYPKTAEAQALLDDLASTKQKLENIGKP